MANSSIDLTSLDFDTLKDRLKIYLRSQSQFSDYDFEGSNMNVLLDILTYNTFHNSFYLNMVVNESYLDSAQLRNSVISHAKELNYLPRSYRSAKASVNLTFTANVSMVTIPKGTSFTSTVGPNILTFITEEESVQFSSNNYFSIQNLNVFEGKLTEDQFVVNYENLSQRYVLSDSKIDTRSITVTIFEDNTGNELSYVSADTTLGLDETSQVFFIQACEDGKYELIFGDNIIGRKPKDSSVVSVSYRVSNGKLGNGAARFTLDDEIVEFTSSPNVNTVDVARGGDEHESIESIKYYAPRYFQTQERAINTADYEILLKQRFPEINALTAYGGEEMVPPKYGKVYISVDISDVDGIPESKIEEYAEFLKPRVPMSIETLFIEPETLYYRVISSVSYDLNTTTLNPEQVKSLVVNQIVNYDQTNLNDFKSSFKYSKFVSSIDETSGVNILSNDTEVDVYKRYEPIIGENTNVNLNFSLPLNISGATLGSQYNSDDFTAISSSAFVYNGDSVFIEDNGNGILRLIKTVLNKKIVIIENIGIVDYATGALTLINFRVDSLPLGETYIRIYAKLASKNFETKENTILALETSQLKIEVITNREI